MMKDTQRIGEVERSIVEGQIADARSMKFDVRKIAEVLFGNSKSLVAQVDTVKLAHSFPYEFGPASRAATDISSTGATRHSVPGEDTKVLVEHPSELFLTQSRLIETRPLVAERADGRRVRVRQARRHILARCARVKRVWSPDVRFSIAVNGRVERCIGT